MSANSRGHGEAFRGVATALAALLVLGAPPLAARAAEPGAAAVPAALTVASEPVGANVFVDGQYQGTTPVEVARLAPGDHRVKLVKDGYLENSRLVSLASGRPGQVQVQLTPRPALQVEPGTEQSGGGGSSSKKWLLVGLGVAAVGAGVFLLLPKNKAPNAGSITMTPTGTGMAGVTNYNFTSTASDPDNGPSPLTYSWNFGDGGTGTGATATHTFAASGSFTVTVTVSDSKATATATASVTVGRNLVGTWLGRVFDVGNQATLRTTQSGGSLSGTLTLGPPIDTNADVWCNGTCAGSISGTVSPVAYPAQVAFSGNIAGLSVSFSGQSTDGGTLTGTTTWSIFGISRSGPATFTRQ